MTVYPTKSSSTTGIMYVYRKDRDMSLTGKTKGGGEAIGIKREFKVRLQKLCTSEAEDIWISLVLRYSKKFSNIQ